MITLWKYVGLMFYKWLYCGSTWGWCFIHAYIVEVLGVDVLYMLTLWKYLVEMFYTCLHCGSTWLWWLWCYLVNLALEQGGNSWQIYHSLAGQMNHFQMHTHCPENKLNVNVSITDITRNNDKSQWLIWWMVSTKIKDCLDQWFVLYIIHTWRPIVFGQPCMNWVCY